MASEVTDVTTVKETVKNIYITFSNKTAIHGVSRTTIRSNLRRVVWAVLVLSSFGWGMYQLVETLQKFFKHPVTSVITVRHTSNMPFPAVTICNLNRLRKSYLPEAVLQDIANMYAQIDATSIHSAENLYLEKIKLEDRRKAWHNITDMLLFCTLNQEVCTADDFTQLTDTINGHCYTFNRDGDEEHRYTTQAGPVHGLVMELNIEPAEYLPLTSTAGFQVIVHDPDVPPFPEDGGIIVQPGLETNIGIEKTKIHRLPEPYGKCDTSSVNNVRNLYETWNYTYTENGCKKSCFQKSLYEMCACCHLELPCNATAILKMAGREVTNESISYCDQRSKKDTKCVESIMKLFKYDKRKCAQSCPPACDETIFRTVVSSGFWPTEVYLAMILNQTNSSSEYNLKRFRERYLKLHVYYANLDFTEITTKPDYDTFKILGDIGGQLGLMLGVSILTAAEIMELLCDILVVYVSSIWAWFFTRQLKLSS